MKRSIWKRRGIQNFFVKNINWKNHIKEMIPELSGACYGIRSVAHINNVDSVKSIYYAKFHSVIKYGIIFGGKFSNSGKLFTLQKKIVKIMAGAQPRTSCKIYLNSLKLVLIQVAESEVWLPDVTHIADGLFICRISLLVFYLFSFTKLIFIVGQGYKC